MQTAVVVLFGLTILGVEVITKVESKMEAKKKVNKSEKEAA